MQLMSGALVQNICTMGGPRECTCIAKIVLVQLCPSRGQEALHELLKWRHSGWRRVLQPARSVTLVAKRTSASELLATRAYPGQLSFKEGAGSWLCAPGSRHTLLRGASHCLALLQPGLQLCLVLARLCCCHKGVYELSSSGPEAGCRMSCSQQLYTPPCHVHAVESGPGSVLQGKVSKLAAGLHKCCALVQLGQQLGSGLDGHHDKVFR